MREQINSNPMVQIGLLAVLALGAAFMLLRGPAAEPDPGPAAATPAATAPAPGVTTETPVDGADSIESTPSAPAEPNSKGAKGDEAAPTLEQGPGMPGKVVDAYAEGDVVAILFYKRTGIDDQRLRRTVRQEFATQKNVTLFVQRPSEVAEFTQITRGVGLDRTPALIVMKPKSKLDDTPVASISYGFRGAGSVRQTIRDALYDGEPIAAHP